MIVYHELKSIEKDLGFNIKTLYSLSNNIDSHYHHIFLDKSDGTKRKLSIPDYILKKVQKSILDNILSYYSISNYACAYTKKSSVQRNARPHIGKKKILKLDIEGFFDHITYSRVKEIVFFKEKYSEKIRILLTMLCYYHDGLPQGAPSSPAITNIIMYKFDEIIGEYCLKHNISFTRYCDDMTFSGDFNEKEVIILVKNELKKMGLFLKNRKTCVVPNTKRQIITGIIVNEKLNLAKEYKNKIRFEMYYIIKYGLDSHLKRIGEFDNKKKYVLSLNGRIAYVLQTTPNDRQYLNYKKIIKKYLTNMKN